MEFWLASQHKEKRALSTQYSTKNECWHSVYSLYSYSEGMIAYRHQISCEIVQATAIKIYLTRMPHRELLIPVSQ